MADDSVKVTFDKEYNVRLYEESKSIKSDELAKESGQFIEKTGIFNEKVTQLVQVLEAHADRIETQKIRAIGLRMATENEVDQRSKQQKALQAIVNERRAELDRYTAQYQSLERIEAEQRVLLDKMTSANVGK